MQGVICRLLQGRIKRGDGHESLNLPFPFYSMGREREGRWSDGAREKRSAGKRRRRTSGLFSEGLQLRSRTGSMREQTKEYPAGWKDSGGVCGASITAFPSKKTAIIQKDGDHPTQIFESCVVADSGRRYAITNGLCP